MNPALRAIAYGGIRGGTTYGETDELGDRVVRDPVTMHDFHATTLHSLGLNHERLTDRFGGREQRLADVAGHVVKAVLACQVTIVWRMSGGPLPWPDLD